MTFVFIVTQDDYPTAVFAGRPSANKWVEARKTTLGKTILGQEIKWRIEKFEVAPPTLDDEDDETLRAEARRHMRNR